MAREFKYADDLSRQRYLVESYNKERDTRLRWYFNTYKAKQADTQANKQYEVMLRKLQAACPKPTEELRQLKMKKESQRNLEEFDGNHTVKLPMITDSSGSDPCERSERDSLTSRPLLSRDMKPVDETTLARIYEGSSREGKGRYGYLRTRHSLRPELKYEYPIVSSWEYGWRLDDVIRVDDMKNPEFGRSRIVADTFYRNNLDGLQGRKI